VKEILQKGFTNGRLPQDRQCTYNVTSWRVRVIIVAFLCFADRASQYIYLSN